MARNKPRKWSNLKGVVPTEGDPTLELSERQKKVHAATDERVGLSLKELAQEWDALEEEEEFEELAKTERNIKFEALERRILAELEKVKALAGTDMWRGEGQTFSPKFMLNPRVTDPVALRQWVEERGLQSMLALPKARLKSIVGEAYDLDQAVTMSPAQRAALKPGDPASGAAPPGVSVFLRETVHHTSQNRKAKPEASDDE